MNYNFKSFVSKNPIVIVSILLIVMTLSFVVCSYTANDDVYAENIVNSDSISIDLPFTKYLCVGNNLLLNTSAYVNNSVAYNSYGYYKFIYNVNTNTVSLRSPFLVVGGTNSGNFYSNNNLVVNGSPPLNTILNQGVDWYFTRDNIISAGNNMSSRVFLSSNGAFRNGEQFFKLEIFPCYLKFTDAAFTGVAYRIYDTSGKYIQLVLNTSFAYTASSSNYDSIISSIDSGTYDSHILNQVYYFQSNLNDNEFYREGFEDGQLAVQNNYNVGGNGYNNIYNVGYDSGYSAGNTAGYNSGYNQGVASANQYTFSALISAVFDVPVRTITGLLDWDILGVNLKTLLLSLFSVAVVIFIVKIALGRS